MREPKHSPGPWTFYPDIDSGVEGAGGGAVCDVSHHGNVNTVARTGQLFSHADGHLIKCAPCMFAMLVGLRDGTRGASLGRDTEAAIDALIARATGETPDPPEGP